MVQTQLVHFSGSQVAIGVRNLVEGLHSQHGSNEVGLVDGFGKHAKPLIQNVVGMPHNQKKDFHFIKIAVFNSMTEKAEHFFVLGNREKTMQ